MKDTDGSSLSGLILMTSSSTARVLARLKAKGYHIVVAT